MLQVHGLTKHAGLQAVSAHEGISVVAFHATNLVQEPGTHDEICRFTSEKFGVTFLDGRNLRQCSNLLNYSRPSPKSLEQMGMKVQLGEF